MDDFLSIHVGGIESIDLSTTGLSVVADAESGHSRPSAKGRLRELTASGNCRPTPAGGHSEMIATKRPLAACGRLTRQRSRSLCDSLVDGATQLEDLCQHSVSLQRYWMIAVAFYACA